MAFDPLLSPLKGFKDNPLGTVLSTVDNGNHVPQTQTVTVYSLRIHATVGRRRGVVGAINELSPRQSMQVDEEWEMDAIGRGLPRELIPQAVENRTLRIARYELYRARMAQVFGVNGELMTLADQSSPFSLRLMWKSPTPSDLDIALRNTQSLSVREFVDCYFTDIGHTIRTGDVIVKADATIKYRTIKPLQ